MPGGGHVGVLARARAWAPAPPSSPWPPAARASRRRRARPSCTQPEAARAARGGAGEGRARGSRSGSRRDIGPNRADLRVAAAPRRGAREVGPYNRRHLADRALLMHVSASVFKAYDIRGIVGTTIDERFAEHLGRAFGSEALAAGETRRRGRPRRPRLGPGAVGRADPRPGLDRPRRRRHRRRHDADALLRRGDARPSTAARAASRSPAATTRRTTTASRWCWPAARSTATRSSACAGAWRPRTTPAARGRVGDDGHRSPSTAPASSATASSRGR